jgi:hypothetical protein
MLTTEEFQCLKIAQRYQRHFSWVCVLSIYRIFWPHLINRIQWSTEWWRFFSQSLILMILWPVFIIIGLFEYLMVLIRFPQKFISTFRYHSSLRSPGEKSLVGINNAFSVLVDLPREYYIRCMDEWIGALYGEDVLAKKSFSLYVFQAKGPNNSASKAESTFNSNMRSDLVVARQGLSLELGHYLLDKPVKTKRV